MDFFIHYRPADGEMLGWGTSADPVPIDGMAIAFGDPFDPDPLTQKYDAEAGAIVDKTADENRARRECRLRRELRGRDLTSRTAAATDVCMVWDYPMPMRTNAAPGAGYRQNALRDSCRGSPATVGS